MSWRTWTAVAGLLADGLTTLVGATIGRLLRHVDDALDTDCDAPTPAELADGWPDVLHVVPNADLVGHDSNEDCVCGPTPEAVFRTDGSNGWLYKHHSLDRREAIE